MSFETFNIFATYVMYILLFYSLAWLSARFFKKYTLAKKMSYKGDEGLPVLSGIGSVFCLIIDTLPNAVPSDPTMSSVIILGTVTVSTVIFLGVVIYKGIVKLRSNFPAC